MERGNSYRAWLSRIRGMAAKWQTVLQGSAGDVNAVMKILAKYKDQIWDEQQLNPQQKSSLTEMVTNIETQVVGYSRNSAQQEGAIPMNEREFGYSRAGQKPFLISASSIDGTKKQKSSWFSLALAQNKREKTGIEVWMQKLTIFRTRLNRGTISLEDGRSQIQDYRKQVGSSEALSLTEKKALLQMLKIDEKFIKREEMWSKQASVKTAQKRNSDVLPSIEQQLREVKKHDVIDVGHRGEDITEIFERQLDTLREGDIVEITEGQLNDGRDEDVVEITEASLDENDLRRPDAYSGSGIKIFEEINARQDKLDDTNDAFYKANPELKGKGGK